MEFVMNNYLWFLIGGIVLLMIIIGYFAEKTNFGKIPLNNKKKQVEPKEEMEPVEQETKDEIKLDEIGIADALAPEENLNVSEKVEEPIVENNMPEEDLNVPFGDVNVEETKEMPAISEPEEELSTSLDTPNVEEVSTVSEISETTEDSSITDESEDDVWKF